MKRAAMLLLALVTLFSIASCSSEIPTPPISNPPINTGISEMDNGLTTARRRNFQERLFDDHYDERQEGRAVNPSWAGYSDKLVGDWDRPENMQDFVDEMVAQLGLPERCTWTAYGLSAVCGEEMSQYNGIQFLLPGAADCVTSTGNCLMLDGNDMDIYIWKPGQQWQYETDYSAKASAADMAEQVAKEALMDICLGNDAEEIIVTTDDTEVVPVCKAPVKQVSGTICGGSSAFIGYVIETVNFPAAVLGILDDSKGPVLDGVVVLSGIVSSICESKTGFPHDIAAERGRLTYRDESGGAIFQVQIPPLGFVMYDRLYDYETLPGYHDGRTKWGVSWLGEGTACEFDDVDALSIAALQILFGDSQNEAYPTKMYIKEFTSEAISKDMVRITGVAEQMPANVDSREVGFFIYLTQLNGTAPSMVWCIDLSASQTRLPYMNGMLMPVAETVQEVEG